MMIMFQHVLVFLGKIEINAIYSIDPMAAMRNKSLWKDERLIQSITGLLMGMLITSTGTWIIWLAGGIYWTAIRYSVKDFMLSLGILLAAAFVEELVFRWLVLTSLMK